MKVLNKPDPYEWNQDHICKECKAELLVELDDVKIGFFGGNYLESGDRQHYFECPVCGEETILTKLPKIVKLHADNKNKGVKP